MYALAFHRTKVRKIIQTEPILKRIFVEPEGRFDPQNKDHIEIWKTMVQHWKLKGIGVKAKVIRNQDLKGGRMRQLQKELFGGFGFIILQSDGSEFAYVHYGSDRSFRYAKWQNHDTIEELMRIYLDLADDNMSRDFEPEDFPEMNKEWPAATIAKPNINDVALANFGFSKA